VALTANVATSIFFRKTAQPGFLVFILNIPFFSPIRRLYEPEANIPLFHGLSDGQKQASGVKSKPGPPDRDSLFYLFKLILDNGIVLTY
jgi:hypothetical protein